jgi:DNA repair protein RadC
MPIPSSGTSPPPGERPRRARKASRCDRDSTPTLFAYVPVFSLRLVRERDYSFPPFAGPGDVARLVTAYLDGCDREHFIAVLLAQSGAVIGIATISIGTLTSALVSPREVFKTALLCNAATVVVAHNHPCGSLEPSREDLAVTKKLAEAGRALDVRVQDHVIVGHGGAFTSLAERGLI